MEGTARVFTDPLASPTGFPFKVALLEGTGSDAGVYRRSGRASATWDSCASRTARQSGKVGYRCASEPVSVFTSKGGQVEETVGRKCVCNGLLANIGMAQTRNGSRTEAALITAGDDLVETPQFLLPGATEYTVADVIAKLMSGVAADDGARVELAAV